MAHFRFSSQSGELGKRMQRAVEEGEAVGMHNSYMIIAMKTVLFRVGSYPDNIYCSVTANRC
jgi:hypothetical protein